MKGKPRKKLTQKQKRQIRAVAAKKDGDIDFSDARPFLDWSKAEIGNFDRHQGRPVTVRLDSDVIAQSKSSGPAQSTVRNARSPNPDELRHKEKSLRFKRRT